MLKLLNGENKKLLQNPSYYFTILLIFVVVIIMAMSYVPKTNLIILTFENKTKEQILEEFNIDIKIESDKNINEATLLIENYIQRKNAKQILDNNIQNINQLVDEFLDNADNLDTILLSLQELKTDYEIYSTSTLPTYYLVNTNDYKNNTQNLTDNIKYIIGNKTNNELVKSYLTNDNFKNNLLKLTKNLSTFEVNIVDLNNLIKTVEIANSNLLQKVNEISIETDKNNLIKKINEYKQISEITLNYAKNKILDLGLSNYEDVKISNFFNFDKINLYDVKEDSLKYEYMILNQKTFYDYSFAPSLSTTNSQTTSFSFAYECTEIAFFIIMIYMMFVCTYSVCGELKKGTLKLLLIRPYKRYKFLLAKIISAFLNSLLFIIITFVSASLVGNIYFNNSLPILVVFNASNVFTISSTLLAIIYILCLALKMLVLISLFMLISTCFKKEIYSVLLSVIIVIFILILKGLTFTPSLLVILPPLNISLFKYFGGAYGINNFGLSVFTQPSNLTVSFIICLIMLILQIIILNIITFKKFKRLEVK